MIKNTPFYFQESHIVLTLDRYKHRLSIKLRLKSKRICQQFGYNENINTDNNKNEKIEMKEKMIMKRV